MSFVHFEQKRSEHRALPEDTQATVEEVPLAPQSSSQPAPPFSFPFANTLFSKHETILGNLTCVMKEIGFVCENPILFERIFNSLLLNGK